MVNSAAVSSGDQTSIMDYNDGRRENNVYLHSLPTGAWAGTQEEAWTLHHAVAAGILYMWAARRRHATSSSFMFKQRFPPFYREERAAICLLS